MKPKTTTSWIDRLVLQPRAQPPPWAPFTPLAAVLLGLAASLGIIAIAGGDPLDVLRSFRRAAIGSWSGITETLVIFVPLALASLGVAVAQKAGFWNIGGEGQILLGGLAGVVFALGIGDVSSLSILAISAASIVAFMAGGLLCGAVAFLKARRRVDEVIITLLSNFAILYLVAYLVSGPLQDSQTQWIQSPTLPASFRFSRLPGAGRLTTVVVPFLIISLLLLYFERRTYWDTVFSVTADSHTALRLQGLSPTRAMILAGILSGGLCGLAGWVEVSAVQYRLIENLSPGYGYYAILVAVLAGGRLLPTLAFAAVMAVLLNAVDAAARSSTTPIYVVDIILGTTLIAQVVLMKLGMARLTWRSRHAKMR